MAADDYILFVKCLSSLTFCGLPMYRLWSFISFSRTKRIITAPVSSSSRAWRFSWSYPPCGPTDSTFVPAVMPRDNIFTRMVAALYRTDTPTNLWPSIHVYNSLGAHFAIIRSKCFEKKKGIRTGSLSLAVSLLWQPCSSNSIPYLMCLLLSSWRLWCTRWYIVMICWSLSESSAIREKQNRRSAKGCFKTCADGAAIKMQWRYPRHCISFALIYDLLHYNTSSLFFNAEAMTASIS